MIPDPDLARYAPPRSPIHTPADPRAVILDILIEWDETTGPVPDSIATWADRQTDRILAALTAAGWSLLPPGGQSGGKELRDAIRRLGHGLIAVSPLLEKPYSDAPEWTPWSRFVHPRLLEVRRLAGIDQPSDTPGEPA